MSFISENFEIVGDSYIDSTGCAHRLKNVRAVTYGAENMHGIEFPRRCLIVLTPYGNDCVIPFSIPARGEGCSDDLLKSLLVSAREEFLELVQLASDPRLRYQEGVNWDSEKLNRRRRSRDSETPP